jgi:hypothetical protein
MNNLNTGKAACLLTGFLLCPVVQAQQLTLFEPTQAERQAPEAAAGPQQVPGIAMGIVSDPAFTLSSAARFANSFQAVLKDRAGQSVVLGWQPGQRTPVPGYPGFSVVEANAKFVVLELPAQERCMTAPERGVACTGTNLAQLSLATLAPLEARPAEQSEGMDGMAIMGPQQEPFGQGRMPEGQVGGEAVFVNPFVGIQDDTSQLSEAEVQARVDGARARAQRLQQFQPERIPEDQVPPGMRLVRTPFGDRLVPVRE